MEVLSSFEAAAESGLAEADLEADPQRPRGRGRAPSHWSCPGTAGPWSAIIRDDNACS